MAFAAAGTHLPLRRITARYARWWCSTAAHGNQPLRLAVVLGSTRPNRLCARVSALVQRSLEIRKHTLDIVDPVALELPVLVQPTFAYAPGRVPEKLQKLEATMRAADGYVIITPEYNHSVAPAISNTMSHVGASAYAFKPSVIVSYSSGQFGGVRAAMATKPFLTELGCLPVSASVSIPFAGRALDKDGRVPPDAQVSAEDWERFMLRAWSQLEFYGNALRKWKQVVDPATASPTNVDMTQRLTPQ